MIDQRLSTEDKESSSLLSEIENDKKCVCHSQLHNFNNILELSKTIYILEYLGKRNFDFINEVIYLFIDGGH